jgi:hypothetical protein
MVTFQSDGAFHRTRPDSNKSIFAGGANALYAPPAF